MNSSPSFFSWTSLTNSMNSLTSLFSSQSSDQNKAREVDEEKPLLEKKEKAPLAPTQEAPTVSENNQGSNGPSLFARLKRMVGLRSGTTKQNVTFTNAEYAQIPTETDKNLIHLPSKDLNQQKQEPRNTARTFSLSPVGELSHEDTKALDIEELMRKLHAQQVQQSSQEAVKQARQVASRTPNQSIPLETRPEDHFEDVKNESPFKLQDFTATQLAGLQNVTGQALSGVAGSAQSAAQSAQSFFANLTQQNSLSLTEPPFGPVANGPGSASNGPEAEAGDRKNSPTKGTSSTSSTKTYETDPIKGIAVYATPKTPQQTQTQVTQTTPASLTAKNLVAKTKTGGPASTSTLSSGDSASTRASSGSVRGSGSDKTFRSTSSRSTGSGSKRFKATQNHMDSNEFTAHKQSVAQEVERDAEKVKKSMEASLERSLEAIRRQEKNVPAPYRTSSAKSANPHHGVTAEVNWTEKVGNQPGGGRGGR